jgi:hypothetical protein
MKYGPVNLGQIEALLNKIGGEEGMNAILSDRAQIAYSEHVIDLDADPRRPYDGWKVEEHKKGGQFKWNASKVQLFLHSKQQGSNIEGNKLRKDLADNPVYNANLLDYLLDNPYLIPQEWKGKEVCFWGTIYRLSDGNLYVRCLVWHGGHWSQGDDCLDGNFNSHCPSAVMTQ